MSFLMVQGGTIDHGPVSVITGGVFFISTPVSSDVQIEGVGVYAGPLTYTFSGGSAPGFVSGTVVSAGPQILTPATSSVAINGQPVPREGDVGVMNATGSLIGGGTGPVVGPVVVSDAGQEEVGSV